MKNILTAIFIFLGCITLLSAQSEKSSLLQALSNAKDDTSKVWLLHDIGKYYRSQGIDSMIYYLQEALDLSRKLDFTEGMLGSMYYLSLRYQYRGEHKKELAILREAMSLMKDQKESGWHADIYKQLGQVYFRDLKYDSAYYAYKETERILKDVNYEYGIWHNNYLLYCLFNAQGEYEKAEQYLQEAYEITKAEGIRKDFGWILVMQIEYYFRTKNWDRYSTASEEYLKFQSDRKQPLSNKHPDLLFKYSDENPDDIIKELESLIRYHQEKNNELSLLETYTYLGNVKTQAGDYKGAIADYLKSINIAEKLSHETFVADNYKTIYQAYELDGNLAAAFPYLKKYHQLVDSLNTVEVRKNISELEVKYDLLKKDEALAQNELALAKTTQAKKIYTIIAIAGSILALVALWFLYFKNRTNRVLKSQKLVIEKALNEKEILLKEIHHRVKNNLQVISSLLNWQSRYIEDNKALQSMKEGRNRVQSMALIHQNLYQSENLTGVMVSDYIDKLGNSLFNSYNIKQDQIQFKSDVEPLNLDVDTLIPLGLILNELLSNALKHAFPEGREGQIQISLQKQEESLLLEVKDDGIGIPDKSVEKSKDSFGYKLIEAFAEKLKAQLQIENAYGTTVRLLIRNFKTV